MSTEAERAQAESIVGGNRYAVIGSADPEGLPWASPVYYAHRGLAEFVWISRPGSTHSQNIARRPHVSLVVFDSTQRIGTGCGFYARATAGLVPPEEIGPALRIFSERCEADGAGPYGGETLRRSGLELYRAVTYERSLLPGGGRPDLRIPLP